jgi:hypothetical protein
MLGSIKKGLCERESKKLFRTSHWIMVLNAKPENLQMEIGFHSGTNPKKKALSRSNTLSNTLY